MNIEMSFSVLDGKIILYNPDNFGKLKDWEKLTRNVIKVNNTDELIWRIDIPYDSGNLLGECIDSIIHIKIENDSLMA